MKVKFVEPVLDELGNIKYSIGKEKVKSYTHEGNEMFHVRSIKEGSKKSDLLKDIFSKSPCKEFISLGNRLIYFLNNSGFKSTLDDSLKEELYIMTDFTDPRQLKGLVLDEDNKLIKKEKLGYLAFNTDWDNFSSEGIDGIFAHEYSHLWLYFLNFPVEKQVSNCFHECSAITDNFTAFFEGFAIHLEIVSDDIKHGELFRERKLELWDNAMDIGSWLSYKSSQLRYFATKNNRFVYKNIVLDIEDSTSYLDLHIADLTTSLVYPGRIKNGSQILATEGAIASIFYHIYHAEEFKSNYLDDNFYERFGACKDEVNPMENLYLKIFYVFSKIDFEKEKDPMISFINTYGETFPKEKEKLYTLFLDLTYYTTVSHEAAPLFEDNYEKGGRGIIDEYKEAIIKLRDFKNSILPKVIKGEIPLDNAIYPELWIKSKGEKITPTPWIPDKLVDYVFNLNTATEVDLLSLDKIELKLAKKLLKERKARNGFKSIDDFKSLCPELVEGVDFISP